MLRNAVQTVGLVMVGPIVNQLRENIVTLLAMTMTVVTVILAEEIVPIPIDRRMMVSLFSLEIPKLNLAAAVVLKINVMSRFMTGLQQLQVQQDLTMLI